MDHIAWPATPPLPEDGQPQLLLMPTGGLEEAALAPFDEWLSEPERARRARFMHARDRLQYATARTLLRVVLSRAMGCKPGSVRLQLGAQGKPEVDAAWGLSFSLSHTEGWVAVALARGARLGVDIEGVRRPPPDHLAVAESFYDAGERIWMAQACDAAAAGRRFIELWTLKESYLKATGHGLGKPLRDCVFSLAGEHGLRFEDRQPAPADADTPWSFALWSTTTGHRISLATVGDAARAASARHWLVGLSMPARPRTSLLLRCDSARGGGA